MSRFLFVIIFAFFTNIMLVNSLKSQTTDDDTISSANINLQKQDQFYDSLKYKANKRKLTKLLYDFIITPPQPYVDKKALALNYYSQMEGKIISEIKIVPLEVFGPTFKDTTKKAKSWVEKSANKIHTKSNLRTIEKLLLFKVGDVVDPEILYENERIIRSLPYIKEISILLNQDTVYPAFVKVTILTKDRFSFGVSGNVNGVQSAAFEVYDNNIFGVGHEIAFVFAGHLNKQPFLGFETYYKINNIRGKFIDISMGYLNTYQSEGYKININKPFITSSIKWGYGLTGQRMYRSNWIFRNDIYHTKTPMDFIYHGAWGGRSFQINKSRPENSQIVFSAAYNQQKFFELPEDEPNLSTYFTNRTFLLAGLTFTKRTFIQDDLVFSYGITEDIPKGFKNEMVYGYEFGEFGNRHYAHISLSNGNLIKDKKGYMYLQGGFGGYFRDNNFEQGQAEGRFSFVTKKIKLGDKISRLFMKSDYVIGIHRHEIENLTLNRSNQIRGFSSIEAIGKQRLSLNFEYVLFLRQEFYKFNMALFMFSDNAFIGSNKEFIFTQNYYNALGFGLRLHNENLVIKTIQLRLAFYPFHPDDMSFIGFVFEEQSKRQFYSFEPLQPQPLRFE